MALSVFLSYGRPMAPLAAALKQSLAGVGIRTAEAEPDEGSEWEDNLRDALEESDAFVAVLTPGSSQSALLLEELGAAMMLDKPTLYIQSGPSILPNRLLRHVVLDASVLSTDQIAERIQERLAA